MNTQTNWSDVVDDKKIVVKSVKDYLKPVNRKQKKLNLIDYLKSLNPSEQVLWLNDEANVKNYSVEELKTIYGELLYPRIAEFDVQNAGKITSVLLDRSLKADLNQLLLENKENFKRIIENSIQGITGITPPSDIKNLNYNFS